MPRRGATGGKHQTVIKYLDPGHGQTRQGYLWTIKHPGPDGGISYEWRSSRSHEVLFDLVPENYSGTLQSDGYKAYQTFLRKLVGKLRKGRRISLAACWAHARRKFKAALDAGENLTRTAWLMRQISRLYRIERHLRATRAGPALREAVRASESLPIIRRLHRALVKIQPRHLPKSLLGQAIAYTLALWDHLVVPMQGGRLEIDNNQCENAIRPTKLGAKNWLFIGAEGAGWQSAVLYTLIENCRHHGLEPWTYLRDLLERLPAMKAREVPALTPLALIRARREERITKKAS